MRNATRRVKGKDKDDAPVYSETQFKTLRLTLSRNGEALQRLSYEGERLE